MNNYIVFPTYNCQDLEQQLRYRAREQGYKVDLLPGRQSVTLNINSGEVTWTYRRDFESDNHELGDLHKFMTTDKYKFKIPYKEVVLNSEYTAKVYKDKVVVGCSEFPIDAIKKLKEAYDCVVGN